VSLQIPDSVKVTEFAPRPEAPVRILGSDYAPNPVQVVSRGLMYWTGSLTTARMPKNESGYRDLIALLVAMEGGVNTFDIPLHRFQDASNRFPARSEATNSTSVNMTARAPASTTATRIGLGAEITLNVPATASQGLRAGDWFSLHSTDLADYYGAYCCRQAQVGNKVVVGPAPPMFPPGVTAYRLRVRRPILRARLIEGVPSWRQRGDYIEPVTLTWIQSD